MFSKFMLDATNSSSTFIKDYYYYSLENIISDHSNKVKSKLDSCIDYNNNCIDGNKLEKELFKEINADVFISHSHNDKQLAIAISGWLEKEMGLTSFVDSCVWDYVDEILSELNNRYNVIRTEADGSKTYNYGKANYFASHLYLMLSSALNNMLDKTECLWFISTENSVIPLDKTNVSVQTFSPWIYNEIVMANTMRQIPPKRPNIMKHNFDNKGVMFEQMLITHQLDLSKFINIDFSIFSKWKNNKNQEEHPLDTLYQITGEDDNLYG